MKRFSFFLALALLVVSFGQISAAPGSISLETTTGEWAPGKIVPNAPVVFNLRYTNPNAYPIGAIANGWRVYGPTTFTSPVGDTLPVVAWGVIFDLARSILTFNPDGVGADTVKFNASKLSSTGLPAGFDFVAFKITTGNVNDGETLCLDSAWFPPAGTWLWAAGGGNPTESPTWSGPHCFLAEVPPCLPPVITNAPVALAGSHCVVMAFDFDATPGSEPGPIVWSASIGTINANGQWQYAPTLADVGVALSVDITATTVCGSTETVDLTFTNAAPVITCPASPAGSYSTGTTNDYALSASDDCDPFTWSIVSADPAFTTATIDPNTGVLTVSSDSADQFCVTVEATDGNATSAPCDVCFDFIAGSLYQVALDCVGDEGDLVYQGQHVIVPVSLLAQGGPIGGYDILIAYDNSALSFQGATIGADWGPLGCQWEYFTYRFGADGNCSGGCPSGLLRVVAIAETNNGPIHPDCFAAATPSVLFNLDFLVTNDRTFECQKVPIRFFWLDCGDNALSNQEGDQLLIAEAVYDGDVDLNPPNGTDIYDPNVGYPTFQGPQDVDCDNPDPNKPDPDHTVSFHNGCVKIACAEEIDARGDLNLNEVANEIADAVLYSNYFIYGIGVFTINMQGQIAASDVNADGLTLSVADLVYLIRVVVGDALPYPKLAAVATEVSTDNGQVVVRDAMGAAAIVVTGNVTPELLATNMEMKYAYDASANVTRVLVFSMEQGQTFSGHFVNANGNVASIELATYEGAMVNAKVIPANYSLKQNYPNPFNPSTTISFAVPSNSDVTLTIYNVTGQKVTELNGSYEAGVHEVVIDASSWSSGIYFYKVAAGNFTATMKMVLLK